MEGLPTGFDVAESPEDVKRDLGWNGPSSDLVHDGYSPQVSFTLSSGESIYLSRWHVRVVIDGSTADD